MRDTIIVGVIYMNDKASRLRESIRQMERKLGVLKESEG